MLASDFTGMLASMDFFSKLASTPLKKMYGGFTPPLRKLYAGFDLKKKTGMLAATPPPDVPPILNLADF